MAVLKGWRFVGFVSCLIGAVGLTLYPIVVDPMYNAEKYKQMQQYAKAKRNEIHHQSTK